MPSFSIHHDSVFSAKKHTHKKNMEFRVKKTYYCFSVNHSILCGNTKTALQVPGLNL